MAMRARQKRYVLHDLTSASRTTSNTTSVETAHDEVPLCKHRRSDKECVRCDCGCSKCHRPGKLCKKQLAESRKKASKHIKDQKKSSKQTKSQKKAAKETKSQKKAGKKRKADDTDDADEMNVKVEESASQSMLFSQPKKKDGKATREWKTKTKSKEKRGGPVDSKGLWFNPIPVPD